MKELVNYLQKIWQNILDDNEFAILQKYLMKGYNLSKLYSGTKVLNRSTCILNKMNNDSWYNTLLID
jgi:hypothetical protein